MSDKFQNKYRIASTRLENWDYGWNASYFVTICTKDRACFFGEIVDIKNTQYVSLLKSQKLRHMKLSKIGKIAQQYWIEIPKHFPFVELGEFIIMPNHVHGIITIDKSDDGRNDDMIETQNFASLSSTSSKNKFGPQSQNLASIIRGYKSGVKKYATLNQIDFTWQPRFHDHIIRNDKSFKNISEYIVANPLNWIEDKFFKP